MISSPVNINLKTGQKLSFSQLLIINTEPLELLHLQPSEPIASESVYLPKYICLFTFNNYYTNIFLHNTLGNSKFIEKNIQ